MLTFLLLRLEHVLNLDSLPPVRQFMILYFLGVILIIVCPFSNIWHISKAYLNTGAVPSPKAVFLLWIVVWALIYYLPSAYYHRRIWGCPLNLIGLIEYLLHPPSNDFGWSHIVFDCPLDYGTICLSTISLINSPIWCYHLQLLTFRISYPCFLLMVGGLFICLLYCVSSLLVIKKIPILLIKTALDV